MSLEMIVYLADVVTSLQGASIFYIVCYFIYMLILWTMYAILLDNGEQPKIQWRIKHTKGFGFIAIFVLLFMVFSPTKETIYTIAGISATKQIASTPEAKKALQIINLSLDKTISKLQESE